MKFNNIYFKTASSFNKILQNAQVTFSFWKGRRFRIIDDKGKKYLLRLNDLVKLASEIDPHKKAFKAIVLKLQELHSQGNHFKEFHQTNCLTRSMVKTIQFFSRKKNAERKETIKSLIKKIQPSFEETLDKKLESLILPIPPENPFHKTDLIVFQNDYKGMLPLNGIYAKDLEEITHIYQQIDDYEGGIKLSLLDDVSDTGVPFKEFVLDCIRKLLTRPTGRKIFSEIIARKIRVWIQPTKTNSQLRVYDNDPTLNELYFNIHKKTFERFITRLPNGKFDLIEDESFTILGHELIHALKPAPKTPPTLANYTNLDEQVTISGLKKPFNLQESFEYYELNENRLRSEFGLKHRVCHTSLEDLRNETILGNDASFALSRYFLALIEFGLIDELKTFLHNNPLIGQKEISIKVYDEFKFKSLNLLQCGLESAESLNQVEILELLKTK